LPELQLSSMAGNLHIELVLKGHAPKGMTGS
jgi:hypothetical protein